MRTARRPALLIEAAGLRDDLLAVNGAAVNVREYRGPTSPFRSYGSESCGGGTGTITSGVDVTEEAKRVALYRYELTGELYDDDEIRSSTRMTSSTSGLAGAGAKVGGAWLPRRIAEVGCRCCGRCTASGGVADTQTCAECKLLLQNGHYDDREVWVPVVGFDGCEISDQGRIRDARTHTAVKATPK